MIKATPHLNVSTGKVTVTTSLVSASVVYPDLDSGLVNVLDHEVGRNNVGPRYVNSPQMGVRFLSRAIDNRYLGYDRRRAAATMESAARMVVVGAVPQMTMAASQAAANAVTQRTSVSLPTRALMVSLANNPGWGREGASARSGQQGQNAGDELATTGRTASGYDKKGFAMWIMPLFQNLNGMGLKAGEFDLDYSANLGGLALGADYTFDNALRMGLSFNIGGGLAESSGELNKTRNDMNFWGVGAYLGWTDNYFGLSADVGYTQTYNKLKQDLPSAMRMSDPKADVRSHALTTGVRAEYRIETPALDITPHAAARMTYLDTESTKIRSNGDMIKADAIRQTIWTFPVGIMFSKELFFDGSWYFKPMIDFAFVPATGDINARQDIRFTGTGPKAQMETQTMDYLSYMGGAGFELGNDTFSLGVNYNLLMGEHTTNHGVFGTLRVNF